MKKHYLIRFAPVYCFVILFFFPDHMCDFSHKWQTWIGELLVSMVATALVWYSVVKYPVNNFVLRVLRYISVAYCTFIFIANIANLFGC